MSYTLPALLLQRLNLLQGADDAYYNGVPTMDDATYDGLRDEFVAMVSNANPAEDLTIECKGYLASISAAIPSDSKWVKVMHGQAMTSLNKCQVESDLDSWYSGCGSPKGGIVVSDKCDGISISLVYKGGKLTQAVTRGKDGTEGEDIYRNVIKMKGVVHHIKGFSGYIRGEIVLCKSDLAKHFPGYSNPRNAAAGIAKREDGEGCEHLTVLHYQLIRLGDGAPIKQKSVEFKALAALGCAVPSWAVCNSLAEVKALYAAYIVGSRAALDYDIDGLVIEFDDLTLMDNLGTTNHRPAGAVAYKFPHEKAITTLRNIRWQVGKSGRVTPVAEFDTVRLAGANVVQASLHNVGNIERLAARIKLAGLSPGDTITVSRRNDVIPYVEEVVSSANMGDVGFLTPSGCPACGHNLVMNGEYLVCYGEDCPAQVLGGISRWVKKIGVLGLGDSVIEALIDGAGITDAADLYGLDPKDIESITTGSGSRLGQTAHIVLAELHSKKEMPLHVFVGSLGIPLCARSVCKTIVDAGFDTLDKMEQATMVQLASIPGMGTTKAAEFVKGFASRRTLMDKLLDFGIVIQAKSVGVLTGKSVCMTGFRSPEMEKAIEAAGGTLKSGVSTGLTYLVQKDASSTSEKSKKAANLGVQVIGIEDMWTILGHASQSAQPVQATAARKPKVVSAAVATPTTTDAPAQGNLFDMFGE